MSRKLKFFALPNRNRQSPVKFILVHHSVYANKRTFKITGGD